MNYNFEPLPKWQFWCTIRNTTVYVDVVFDDDEIPRFHYHFGCRTADRDNPLEIGQIINFCERNWMEIYKLLSKESGNWTCHDEEFEIVHIEKYSDESDHEVELPKR